MLGFGAAAALAAPFSASAAPAVRLGTVQFGTVQWLADVIRRHRLDARHGVALRTVTLADTGAARVAIMAGAADVVVSDWMFVAAQRAAGTRLCFAPLSNASGGIMVKQASPVRTLADLKGRKLGVAGGPTDKSWLLVRAAAKAETGADLQDTAEVVYAAPPLLNAKLLQGELDAALTFWNFAARLDVAGCREVVSVDDCAQALGLPKTLPLIGFVFKQDWADAHRADIDGLLSAVSDAEALLASSDAEWAAIRPLMDAKSDALFAEMRSRFRAGIAQAAPAQQKKAAEQMFAVLLRTGGPRATAGLHSLPAGIFWPTPYG